MGLRRYAFRNLLALDILGNTICGGDLEPISDSLARHEREGNKVACWVCGVISSLFRERDHCQRSSERTRERYRKALAADPE
jgi:hypothetical protein